MNTAALDIVIKAAECHMASERVRLKQKDKVLDTEKEDLELMDTSIWMMRNTLTKELSKRDYYT